jgi:hypothetical protein
MLVRDIPKQNWAYPADLAIRIGGRERMVAHMEERLSRGRG